MRVKHIWHWVRAVAAVALLNAALFFDEQIVDKAMTLRRAAQDLAAAKGRDA